MLLTWFVLLGDNNLLNTDGISLGAIAEFIASNCFVIVEGDFLETGLSDHFGVPLLSVFIVEISNKGIDQL